MSIYVWQDLLNDVHLKVVYLGGIALGLLMNALASVKPKLT